ncbi:[protein-PII] uridylyltransferase [Terricaulis silvestris]|uniref:Bifunctional uridylyltransferase/uridylyl-removing enzyme n=1 Tax=Terricaulis silvestris TaxID=2686094 RepID=A0A6I6MX42_9CAUL|nr:[protein-PII] uridylyltransferase [Terricaulis silvestris]QGZ96964.1 PII uridylyl-transferase [Terricaulis silvestris]
MIPRFKPARIEHVVDGHRLRAQLSAVALSEGENARASVKNLLHHALFRGRMIAKERLEAGEDGLAVARLLAQVADEVVSALYDYTTVHLFRARNPTEGERFTVMAVGGYGRGELAPSSDLDLLFLRAYKPTAFSESVTEYMLYMLWDMGLKVGHASRNVDESLKLAREDHTIQTALLEARRIAGDQSLAEELLVRFRKEVAQKDHAGFIAAKLKERDERHQRVGASRYMVEPNIKEGKGGLRDLHTLFWMARHRYGFEKPEDYVTNGVFTEEERFIFRRALRFLWTARCHLHFLTARGEERLTFDVQPEMAKRMGYHSRANQTDVERFMKRYFLVAKEVGMLTRVLCARLEADHAKNAPRGLQRFLPPSRKQVGPDTPGFVIEGGRLNIESAKVLDTPSNVVRLFEIAERRDLDVHPNALGEAARRTRRMTPQWRKDEGARASFLKVATSERHPGAALRLMNEAGVLGKFVPEFGRIVAQMQFNMYHHYTVDEHTLQAIDAMSEIEHGRHKDQHPLATEIFSKIINRRALYLAMLLHDTGKGDGDQQIEGAKSARAACTRLGLPKEEVELVAWLVGNHLVMSDVAQKRDISDPRTIATFAETVGTVERLRLLLVLTVSDIRAVGPTIWNDWKGQLLRDLYRLTEAALHGGRSDEEGVRAHLAEIAGNAKEQLLGDIGEDESVLAPWLGALEDGYWINHDAEARVWHTCEVLAARNAKAIPHVATRFRETQGVTEVLVYAADRPGLFASLSAAVSASGADIADARVHTTKDGAAFDVFSIQTTDHKPFGLRDPALLVSLTERLHRAALSDHPLPDAKPAPRRFAAFSIEPWVRLDNELTPCSTVLEASGRDRVGLLAELAHVFAEAKVSIVSAHIDTLGERASDVFYVQEEGGGQVSNPQRIATLRNKLEAVLRAAEPAAPADPAKKALAVARASTAR